MTLKYCVVQFYTMFGVKTTFGGEVNYVAVEFLSF